jgi:glutathione peroxidase-family protein
MKLLCVRNVIRQLSIEQFGFQEPGDGVAIRSFAQKQGFEGIILSKQDVNGPKTRPLFAYLKHVTEKPFIEW